MAGREPIGLHFINSRAFDREWRRLRLGDEQLRALQIRLIFDPEAGDVVAGTGGLRKLRWAVHSGQGKSGGARVCYAFFPIHRKVFLILLYAKASQANITAAQKPIIAEELKIFLSSIERGLI
jgi:hypothetical protein